MEPSRSILSPGRRIPANQRSAPDLTLNSKGLAPRRWEPIRRGPGGLEIPCPAVRLLG